MSPTAGPAAVEPAHLLRAALDDAVVVSVLRALGVEPHDVRVSLEQAWLAGLDVLDPAALAVPGVEVAQVLRALSPGTPMAERWGGRPLSPAARAVLVAALGEAAKGGSQRVTSGHLLVGLAACRDPLVAGALAEHGVRLRDVRRLTRRHGRRA